MVFTIAKADNGEFPNPEQRGKKDLTSAAQLKGANIINYF